MVTENKLDTINVGMVGHIDHGKTTLLQKLSGKWTDTHSEELKRGITIKLGYADIVLYSDNGKFNISKKGKPVRHVSFIDAPGHEMLMATMLSGAAMIDAAVLVIAANEGIKPQTREHLVALQTKGVKNVIVAQNKIDLVTKEKAKENYLEIKKLLQGKFENVKIIPVSAHQEVNIDQIWKELAEIKIERKNEGGEPLFVVARSFDINRPGTTPENLKGAVLGGILKKGKLKVGDEIEIKPGLKIKEANQIRYKTLKTSILSLYKGSEKVDELDLGGSMSIETGLDMFLGKNDLLAGNVVSLVGKLPELAEKINLRFKLFQEAFGLTGNVKVEPIKASEMLMLSINTAITGGTVKKINKDELEFHLKIPIIVFKGDNVGIARNINGHWRLIGAGEIV